MTMIVSLLLYLVLSPRFILVPAQCRLRLISPDISRPRRSRRAVVHVGTFLAEAGVTANVSTECSTVCLRVNGSSHRGCFDGDSGHGGLLPVEREGLAWVSGHIRTVEGYIMMPRPFAVRIPTLEQLEAPKEERLLYHETHPPLEERRSSPSRIDDDSGAVQCPSPEAVPCSSKSTAISVVLLVTLVDASRARLLMTTLEACGAFDLFHEFFVVVPGPELTQIREELHVDGKATVVLVDEQELLPENSEFLLGAIPRNDTYALQMILKLLASSLMRTPYYLTLDADILCVKERLSEEDLLPEGKGNYVPERRQVHPMWWAASARTLRVDGDPLGGGFGVTPAVLSTVGSMLTLERLRELYGSSDFLPRMLDAFGRGVEGWWSEYTLYRLALDHLGAFDALHAVGPTKLIGESVWFADDFSTWDATSAFHGDTAAFVVVQSTAGVDTGRLVELVSHILQHRQWKIDAEEAPSSPQQEG